MSNDKPEKPVRTRLQELLRIPERDRTDEIWDEIHELEISIAPGNIRDSSRPMPTGGNVAPPQHQHHHGQKRGGGGGPPRRNRNQKKRK